MHKNNNDAPSVSKVIFKTAGKTAAALVVLLVLVWALFLLLAPMRASDFLYSLGMKGASANLAYTAAQKSDDFDDWWSVLVKSVSANNYAKAYESADKIEKHTQYNEKIAEKTINAGTYAFEGKYYVAYNKAWAGVLVDPQNSDNLTGMWNYVRDWLFDNNGWGASIPGSSSSYSLNPVKGYIDACCNDGVLLDGLFGRLEDLYYKTNKFEGLGGFYSSQQKDLVHYVLKLIEARDGDENITNEVKQFWNGKLS